MFPIRRNILLFGFLWALLIPAAAAQLRLGIDSILTDAYPDNRILFTVSRDGEIIQNFAPTDLTVYEDGEYRPSEFLYCDSTVQGSEVSILLLLDRSGSMAGQPLTDAIAAAISFVGQLRAGDEIGVIAFDTWIQTVSPFTSDKNAATNAIRSIRLGDMTNLWGACMTGISFIASRPLRKAVVLLTDGYDNQKFATVDAVIDSANARNIPFYCIGLSEAVDSTNLQELSRRTGGRYFFSPTSTELADIYDQIARIITVRGVCAVRYMSSLPCLDGQMHAVRLEASIPGASASATGSYRAPWNPAGAISVDAAMPRDVVVEAGGSFELPLALKRLPANLPVTGLVCELDCDTALLKLAALAPAPIAAGYAVSSTATSAGYRLTAAGSPPITTSGEILRARFEAAPGTRSRKTRLVLHDVALSNPCLRGDGSETTVAVSGTCERATRLDTMLIAQEVAIVSSAPNPLRAGTTIGVALAREGWLSVRVVDIFGNTVRTLADGPHSSGAHYFEFLRGDLPSGAYFCIARSGEAAVTRRILLVP